MPAVFSTDKLVFNKAVHYPDMAIAGGAVTFIQGESGCGKTSLFKLFNSSLSPSSGRIFYKGQDIEEINPLMLRREVVLVGQNAFLFDLTIKGNFLKFHAYNGQTTAPTEDEMRFWLDLCLARLPLDVRCITLSGGEKHRVFMAIGLSFKPLAALLDEPTAALDGTSSSYFFANVAAYFKNQGASLVVVSHDQRMAERFADETIVLGNLKQGHYN